jgi:hypothetical protein
VRAAWRHQAYCDGKGGCGKPIDTPCVKFACGSSTRKASCAANADCAAQYRCDTAKHDCVPIGAKCEGDHTLVSQSEASDCAPFQCSPDNECLNACTSRADRVSGMSCTADGKCVPPVEEPGASDSGCGCRSVSRSGVGGVGVSLVLALAAAVRRRVRRRAGVPMGA